MENKQGIVDTISQQNNAVQISGIWYSLGERVKMNYIKKGNCEYSTEETPDGQNDIVTFCKSVQTQNLQNLNQNFPQKTQSAFENSDMNRMSALKFAGNVYMGTGQENDAKRLAEEAHEYLQRGQWVSR